MNERRRWAGLYQSPPSMATQYKVFFMSIPPGCAARPSPAPSTTNHLPPMRWRCPKACPTDAGWS